MVTGMSFRLRPKFTGLFHDEVVTDSFWIREQAALSLPSLAGVRRVAIVGEVRPPNPADPTSAGTLGLQARLDGSDLALFTATAPGPFRIEIPVPPDQSGSGSTLALLLTGVRGSNLLAWLGRVTGLGFLRPWRVQ